MGRQVGGWRSQGSQPLLLGIYVVVTVKPLFQLVFKPNPWSGGVVCVILKLSSQTVKIGYNDLVNRIASIFVTTCISLLSSTLIAEQYYMLLIF